MKICKLIISLMLAFTMLCSTAVADSLVLDAMLKVSDASDEWQIIYLACYTADGMTRYGYIQNNWAKLKAVCSGVEFPTTLSYELVTAEEDEEMVALRISCAFDDKAVISITSEPVAEEECLSHFHTGGNLIFSDDMISFILLEEDEHSFFGKTKSNSNPATFYWLSVDEYMQSYGSLLTVQAEMTLFSPYASTNSRTNGLGDVSILLYADEH